MLLNRIQLLLLAKAFDAVDNLRESGVHLGQVSLLVDLRRVQDGFPRGRESQIHVCLNVTEVLDLVRLLDHFSHSGKQVFKLALISEANGFAFQLVHELDDASEHALGVKARAHKTVCHRACPDHVVHLRRVMHMVFAIRHKLDGFSGDG